ncbi:MAG: hypothetical protein KDK39_07125 [Leptospiraceae bacterium]|nr:hypothetical protein [Leptospiraceae bacterium]
MQIHRQIKLAARLGVIALAILSLSACIYTNVRAPGMQNFDTRYTITTADFTILGTVEAEGEVTTILGLVATGGNGYSALYAKAKALGGDEIINYSFDIDAYTILLFVYNKGTWKARATAIKYKNAGS